MPKRNKPRVREIITPSMASTPCRYWPHCRAGEDCPFVHDASLLSLRAVTAPAYYGSHLLRIEYSLERFGVNSLHDSASISSVETLDAVQQTMVDYIRVPVEITNDKPIDQTHPFGSRYLTWLRSKYAGSEIWDQVTIQSMVLVQISDGCFNHFFTN